MVSSKNSSQVLSVFGWLLVWFGICRFVNLEGLCPEPSSMGPGSPDPLRFATLLLRVLLFCLLFCVVVQPYRYLVCVLSTKFPNSTCQQVPVCKISSKQLSASQALGLSACYDSTHPPESPKHPELQCCTEFQEQGQMA